MGNFDYCWVSTSTLFPVGACGRFIYSLFHFCFYYDYFFNLYILLCMHVNKFHQEELKISNLRLELKIVFDFGCRSKLWKSKKSQLQRVLWNLRAPPRYPWSQALVCRRSCCYQARGLCCRLSVPKRPDPTSHTGNCTLAATPTHTWDWSVQPGAPSARCTSHSPPTFLWARSTTRYRCTRTGR